MVKKLRSYLVVGVLMSVGVALFSVNAIVGAQTLPPEPPAMHDRPVHEKPPCDMKGPFKEEQEAMLKLLGIDEKTFRDSIRDGKSLADIAKKQNVEIDRVINLIETQLKEHARERAEEIVNQKPMLPPPPPKPEK